jgi:hypothetical protein
VDFDEFARHERQRNAVGVCVERLKRFDVAPDEAVWMLLEAAENNVEVLVEQGGSPEDEDEGRDTTEGDYAFRSDPLMAYIDRLIDAAVRGSSGTGVESTSAELVEQERRLLNAPLSEAFGELTTRVPELAHLETELRETGSLADPTSRAGWRGVLHRWAASRNTKLALSSALRARLASLVGGSATTNDPLARTFIAYEVAWNHLRSVAGDPPARAWDEPPPPTPRPEEMLARLRQSYRKPG